MTAALVLGCSKPASAPSRSAVQSLIVRESDERGRGLVSDAIATIERSCSGCKGSTEGGLTTTAGDNVPIIVGLSAGDARFPSVCAVVRGPVETCAGDICKPAPGDLHVICNAKALARIEMLSRIQSSNQLVEMVESDTGLMSVATMIDDEPQKLDRYLTPFPEWPVRQRGDIARRFTTLLLAHELWHVEHPRRSTAFYTSAADIPLDLRPFILCRNADEFEKAGWTWNAKDRFRDYLGEEDWPRARTEPQPTKAVQEVLDMSAAIWADEVAADAFAGDLVARSLRIEGAKDEDAYGLAGMVALYSLAEWYGRLDRFMTAECLDVRDKSFGLTLCLCEDRHRYRDLARNAFSDDHPPMFVRARSLVASIEKGRPKDTSSVWSMLIDMLRIIGNSARKVSVEYCEHWDALDEFVPPTVYAALDNVRIDKKGNWVVDPELPNPPGYPTLDEAMSIKAFCGSDRAKQAPLHHD